MVRSGTHITARTRCPMTLCPSLNRASLLASCAKTDTPSAITLATSVRLTANRSVDCVFDRAASTSNAPAGASARRRTTAPRSADRTSRMARRVTSDRRERSRPVESASLTRCSVERCRCARLSSASSGALPSAGGASQSKLDGSMRRWMMDSTVDSSTKTVWSGRCVRPAGSRTSRIAAPSLIRSPALAVDSLTGRSLMNVPLAESRSLIWSKPSVNAIAQCRRETDGSSSCTSHCAVRPAVMLWPGVRVTTRSVLRTASSSRGAIRQRSLSHQ